MRTRPAQRVVAHPRKGSVPLEILLFLGIYTGLLLLLMAIGSAGRAVSQANETAREKAWSQRNSSQAGASQEINTRSLGRFLGPGGHPRPEAGLVTGRGQTKMAHVLPGLTDKLPQARRDDWTVTGAWDRRLIRFARNSGSHPPLTLDPQSRRWAGAAFQAGQWSALGRGF
ncbi:MAG: hypothetical protein JSS02_11115 [Planctomycetes bacterium]|nr:hypothetical protein [Planctomycetota bacterium]